MSIFREHNTNADRSASDRRRHNKKIEEAIKDGVHNIVAEESIIGQDGKKKIKIPVRGNKEYRFIYGDNNQNKKVGSAPGKDIMRGQKIGDAQQRQQGQGNKPGDEAGEEYPENESEPMMSNPTEIIEEMDANPEQKKFNEVVAFAGAPNPIICLLFFFS